MQAAGYMNTADILRPLKKARDPFLIFTSKACRKWEKKGWKWKHKFMGRIYDYFAVKMLVKLKTSPRNPGLVCYSLQLSFTLINSL